MRVFWRGIVASVGLAVSLSACATSGESQQEASSRFLPSLPPMPAMPSLPTINIADMRIPGTYRQAPAVDPEAEPVIYWRVIEDDILIVHADTNGCTSRADYLVNVEQYHDDIYTVHLTRQVEDRCTAPTPWGVQLGFGFEELGVPIGGQVILLNPIDTERPWDWNENRTSLASRR
ncbi:MULTISPECIES: hypothetical protein [Maricaulis]|uniref:Lipoprotein n=1 Tax=Maricaulis maris (strain MCS10) TaxID=394221 RepID=Q0AQX7_MARMM|nr:MULTISPECIES: hypothetical protein [Maricaulis]ABI65310.1 hypothetical protein Mmar10_1017 [Maricaulis maris MCS10]